MKKLVKILSVAAVLLCGIMLTGCGAAETIKEYVDSTHRTWYKYNGSTNLTIPLGNDDNSVDSDETGSLANAEIYVYYDNGLTVAVQSTNEQEVQLYGGLISSNQEVTIGGTKTYSEQEFGTVKWTALLAAANFKQQSQAPKIYSNPEACVIIGGDNAKNFKIQWKKFLKQKLIDTFLSE